MCYSEGESRKAASLVRHPQRGRKGHLFTVWRCSFPSVNRMHTGMDEGNALRARERPNVERYGNMPVTCYVAWYLGVQFVTLDKVALFEQ